MADVPVRSIPPKRTCIEDGCGALADGLKERCLRCHRRWRYANDPEYRARRNGQNKKWNRENRDYWQRVTKERIRNESEEARDHRLSRLRSRHLQRKYGISIDDYRAMWMEQGGLCWICEQPETRRDVRTGEPNLLAVDHSAETGRVRGLLCAQCNRALGLFGDSPTTLRRAAKYLTERSG